MTEAKQVPAAPPIHRAGPLTLMAQGRQAFREVGGLRWLLWKGFILNYLVFIVLAALIMGGLYIYVVEPWSQALTTWQTGEGLLWTLAGAILQGLLWFTQALLMAATLLFSFLLSLALMSLWFEALAGRIVHHFRPGAGETAAFSLAAWLRSLGRGLRDGLWLLVLSVLALVLGFIPVIGPVLVVVIDSYLLGREVRDPYIAVREESGDDPKRLRAGLTAWTFQVGLLPMVLAMLPVVGWLLLPAVMMYLVAGVAYGSEAARRGR